MNSSTVEPQFAQYNINNSMNSGTYTKNTFVVDNRTLIHRAELTEHCEAQHKNINTTFSFSDFAQIKPLRVPSYSTIYTPTTFDVTSMNSSVAAKKSLTSHESKKKRSWADIQCGIEDMIEKDVVNDVCVGTSVTKESLPLTKKLCLQRSQFPPPTSADTNPEAHIRKLFESSLGFAIVTRPTLELTSQSADMSNCHLFPAITEDNLNGYDVDITSAVREENLDTLRKLHSSGRSMSCSNRFGESLLHMACRRGFTAIVKFLVEEADVAVRITDDCGRTPLHDTLWNRDCQYEIFNMLVERDPSLLLVSDKRGHTPFAYARKENWSSWIEHLLMERECITNTMDSTVMNLFRKEPLI